MAYYPEVGFYFRVHFGLPEATANDVRFQEVQGLTASLEEETITEGGENRFKHKLPKGISYGDLTLKRGMLKDSGLITWVQNALENFRFVPINVNIHLLGATDLQDPKGAKLLPAAVWAFENVYPKSWSVTGLNASQSGIAVEELKLNYQRFRRIR